MILFSALRNDVAHRSRDPAVKEATNDLMGLLTPVIKGVLTDRGFANAVSAQQMYGGHGYIVETGVEQFVRDVRITPLYEGANGIQALDLVARKLPRDNWRAIRAFIGEIDRFIEANGGQERLAPAMVELQDATSDLKKATAAQTKFAMKDPNDAIAGSTDYMHLLGLVALGYMWAMMIKAVKEKITAGEGSEFLATKLSTGAFFLERTLPETALHLRRILAGGKNITDVAADAF